MSDTTKHVSAVRASHDRFSALLAGLDGEQVTGPSYASEWSIADTASHLGSQAEIFGLFLDAALNGTPAPGGAAFGPIWDRWNALPPAEQAAQSVAANEDLVSRIEAMTDAQKDAFRLDMFGMDVDFDQFLTMRLAEHAVHSWDVEVILDPAATVAPEFVELLIDGVPRVASRGGKAVAEANGTVIETTEPARRYLLTVTDGVTLTPDADASPDALQLPAEAFLRLVYGRLDREHLPAGVSDDGRITLLRSVFPGF
jgi:uncharacterized protein (TIGR03083 family)